MLEVLQSGRLSAGLALGIPWVWGLALSHVADCDPRLSENIFNIPVSQIEPIVERDGVADDIWRKSVTCICIHWPILSIPAVSLAIPLLLHNCHVQNRIS
jgi:hypothetical protein